MNLEEYTKEFINSLRNDAGIFDTDAEDIFYNQTLDILQERLRMIQDPDSFERWKQTHSQEEIDSYNCVMYSHSEWILGYMTADWCTTVNESWNNEM